jgi:hypothetical protein
MDQFDFTSGNRKLPNSNAVLILGILSIPMCCCLGGFLGVVLAILALVFASKGISEYDSNPSMYDINSFNNLKAGRVCAIIGLVLSGIYFLFTLMLLSTFGFEIFTDPKAVQEAMEEMMKR